MYYDITNPDVAYYWLHKALHIKRDEFIETYIIECHNDFDTFYEKYHSIIEKIDVENLEIVAFQVTSNSNEVIAPENIIEYVPTEKWRKDVLKYFGKE